MCGIIGTFNFSVSKEEFLSAVDCLSHRGPDNTGHFHDRLVNLGHTRLSIIDITAHSNQPLWSRCGNFIISFNGEIYNYRELKKKHNLITQTDGDTEVILELYKKLGKNCLNELNGIFAFAIYDKVGSELFIARDQVGIKPLYYYKTQDSIIFSSELKAIKKLVPNLQVSYDAISAYLHLGYIPAPMSIYDSVFKLEPASYLAVKKNVFSENRYWDINSNFSEDAIRTVPEAKSELGSRLNAAVTKQLVADVPIGVFLSGGIDSSLVAAIASKNHPGKLNTFSIGFSHQKFNEASYARSVADHLKTNHHEFFVKESDAIELIPEIVPAYDEPFADSSAIPTMLLSRETKKHVTVALSGDGGDELFMGYGAYKWANRLDNGFIKVVSPFIKELLLLGDSQKKRAAKLFDKNEFLPSHIFSQEQYLFSEHEAKRCLIGKSNFLTDPFFKNISKNCNRKLRPSEFQALFDWHYYLPDDLLTKVDRASMKYALEVRVPLLDIDVVKFAINIDHSLKLSGGNSKFILKQILFDEIPPHLFNRPKHGFSVPLSNWLKKDLKYLIDNFLNKEIIETQNILNYKVVKKLIDNYFNGHDYLYNRIWQLIILNQWFKLNT